MKYLKWNVLLRWALTALLIWAVYTETGPWTVITLALFVFRAEGEDYLRWRSKNPLTYQRPSL